MPNPIRVVVAHRAPRMLREIVERAIALQPDMELVDATGAGGETAAVQAGDVAIVVETLGVDAVPDALMVNPRIKAIVLTDEGRAAHVVELCERTVDDVSPQGLVDAIRAAVRQPVRGDAR